MFSWPAVWFSFLIYVVGRQFIPDGGATPTWVLLAITVLGTAAELGLNLPILLWDNNALGEIRDNMVAAQIAPVAVHLENPEWQHLAAAYRCGYEEPGSIEELCAAINAGFSAGRPTLIRAAPALAG